MISQQKRFFFHSLCAGGGREQRDLQFQGTPHEIHNARKPVYSEEAGPNGARACVRHGVPPGEEGGSKSSTISHWDTPAAGPPSCVISLKRLSRALQLFGILSAELWGWEAAKRTPPVWGCHSDSLLRIIITGMVSVHSALIGSVLNVSSLHPPHTHTHTHYGSHKLRDRTDWGDRGERTHVSG